MKIADYVEGVLPGLPEEEKWGIGSKLRNRALDLASDIAEGYGSIDPRDTKWHFGAARRDLFGLKSVLKVAHTRAYIEIDPTMMVEIDKAIDELDKEIQRTTNDIPKWYEEMQPSDKKDGKK
jgi:four helix bundle protein